MTVLIIIYIDDTQRDGHPSKKKELSIFLLHSPYFFMALCGSWQYVCENLNKVLLVFWEILKAIGSNEKVRSNETSEGV